jgi:aminoglycoside 6'-N-acetyltransferase I
MHIVDLDSNHQEMIAQTANLLVVGFKHSWPDMRSALVEVHDCLQPDKINRIALGSNQLVVGWIGGQSAYDGHVWELHPLVVHPDFQGQGIGQALVHDFEKLVKTRGGITIYLGTDDDDYKTSLASVNVYPNVLEHLSKIKNLNRHPYVFYQKVGFVIVGMIPDANGLGKPDIIMAKRVKS